MNEIGMRFFSIKHHEAIKILVKNGTKKKLVDHITSISPAADIRCATDANKFVIVEIDGYAGVAKKCPKDKFNFDIGFSIALTRAIKSVESVKCTLYLKGIC